MNAVWIVLYAAIALVAMYFGLRWLAKTSYRREYEENRVLFVIAAVFWPIWILMLVINIGIKWFSKKVWDRYGHE